MFKFVSGEANIDFVGKMRTCAIVSTIVVGASVVVAALLGLNFGIDFDGGYEIQAKFPSVRNEAEIKEVVNPLVAGGARVQRFGASEDNEFLVTVRKHGSLTEAAKKKLKDDFVQLAGGDRDKLLAWSIAESGESLKVGFDSPIEEQQVRDILTNNNVQIKTINRGERDDEPEFAVSLVSLSDFIERDLREKFDIPAEHQLISRVEFVGPQVGGELRNQGIWAVVAALFFILLYIGFRFDLFFAPGAVVALVHDVLITVGVFSIFQLEFNLPIIAAILAIVGYSLNDTIVVYDRIRENTVRFRGRELYALVNTSINQTISRTLLTSITTLIVVLALWIFGGGIIRDFSIALFVGVLVGTYSSVFVGAPIYILLRAKYGKATARQKSERSSVATAS